MDEPHLVAVGRLVRTHGVRGAVKVLPYGENLMRLDVGGALTVSQPASSRRSSLTLAWVKAQGKFLLMQFQELHDMNEAQTLVGGELFLAEADLAPLEEGEYYHFQLLGMEVVTIQGTRVGTLKSIMEAGGHDVYVIDREGKEVLVPAVDEFIREVDIASRRMVIDPLEGLIDDL